MSSTDARPSPGCLQREDVTIYRISAHGQTRTARDVTLVLGAAAAHHVAEEFLAQDDVDTVDLEALAWASEEEMDIVASDDFNGNDLAGAVTHVAATAGVSLDTPQRAAVAQLAQLRAIAADTETAQSLAATTKRVGELKDLSGSVEPFGSRADDPVHRAGPAAARGRTCDGPRHRTLNTAVHPVSRPRNTTLDRGALLDAFSSATASFGDGTGRWRSCQELADILWVDYGRMSGALRDAAADGLVRRQPEGADYWQLTAKGTRPTEVLSSDAT